MGPPAMELRDPDGTRLLYYPTRAPREPDLRCITEPGRGADTGAQRAERRHFQCDRPGHDGAGGPSHDGPPREKDYFSNLGQTAWDYKFQDTWGYEAIFSVMIDKNGIVVSKFTKRLERVDRGR